MSSSFAKVTIIRHGEFDLGQPWTSRPAFEPSKLSTGDCRPYPNDAAPCLSGASKTNRLTFAHSEHW
jgi:hypothetical protein